MRRTVMVAAAGLAMAALAACAPLRVRSFEASGAGVAGYRTYQWADDGERATGDPRLDSNPFFERRIIADADRELAARGYERVTDGSAGLVLHYHASVGQQLSVGARGHALDNCRDCAAPSLYDEGTLMLDLVDAKTEQLLWRAWAEGSIDGLIDNQQWLEEHIDRAIARIVATLPRRM